MADGLLLLLVGEENRKRKNYEDLKKVYEAEVVFGIETDTYDALGLVGKVDVCKFPEKEAVGEELVRMVGKKRQQYPPYSSKPVNGKPLYWWARQNRLSEIEMPEKEIEIYSAKILSYSTLTSEDLLKEVLRRIALVDGDFRQEEIALAWKKCLSGDAQFLKVKIEVACSSGTYIRKFASDLGKAMDCGGFAYTITRTCIGRFVRKKL
jgi:tRNA pseudouridine55 synthase